MLIISSREGLWDSDKKSELIIFERGSNGL